MVKIVRRKKKERVEIEGSDSCSSGETLAQKPKMDSKGKVEVDLEGEGDSEGKVEVGSEVDSEVEIYLEGKVESEGKVDSEGDSASKKMPEKKGKFYISRRPYDIRDLNDLIAIKQHLDTLAVYNFIFIE
eukprot:GHVT01091297.1.p1 GENE.GHVT01091297.1~~GHVT01091297.1.p1  ORF type:complete len:130 (+),score=8.77 GHVT01091297.1:868-1257(+)